MTGHSPPIDSVVGARRELAARFRAAGSETAALDARYLVEAAVGEGGLALDPLAPLEPKALELLLSYAERHLAGEPIWRIIGEREFWSLPFKLSPATLEPRPDSETIIDAALAQFKARRDEPITILDIGTGTGCLLIALLSEFREAKGLGVDISPQACETAALNAARNGVGERATFHTANWVEGIDRRFDLIVSNPPYIPAGDIPHLDANVRDYDPIRALDGGVDGLDAYRALAAGLPAVMAPGAVIVLEIGAGQEPDVALIMAQADLAHLSTRRDLGGHARALIFAAK